MTARRVPNLRTVKLDALAHPCPEAGGRSRTRQPRARLERWQILRDLIVDAWANPHEEHTDLFARHLGSLSPLEADLIRKMFLNAIRVLPIPDGAVVDTEGRTVAHDDPGAGITTTVRITFTIEHADGAVEHVRLKTGRRPSSDDESAVVWSEAEEGETFTDLMAWPGEMEPIEPPADVEARLRRLVEGSPALARSGVRPGVACVWCPRTATCGAFPAERVVPTNARTVTLTKTDVEDLERCHRRVAWRRVHGIPRDDGDELDAPTSASQGRLFHGLMAAAHGESHADADAAAERHLDGVPPSEVADLRALWDQHRRLLDADGLTVRSSEFPVGVTILEGAGADVRGVTIIGFVDLTARDAAGRSVALEVKTGAPADTRVEDDLYAAGMRRWVGGGPLVIHRHGIGPGHGACEVVEVAPEDLQGATERLGRRVAPVHQWDWEDPLQPRHQVGPWCGGCEFRSTCEPHR